MNFINCLHDFICVQEEEVAGCSPIIQQQLRPADIPQGTCRIMLPNGHYQTVDIYNSGCFKR